MAANTDKETISRLREALANMNKDYMQTKLELDQMKASGTNNNGGDDPSQQQQQPQPQQKPDLGAHLLKFSSRVKALHSNINTKLATAGIQINNLSNSANSTNPTNEQIAEMDSNGQQQHQQQQQQQQQPPHQQMTSNDKEIRRLRDDIESLQTQMKNLRAMLEIAMNEKDTLQKERNELLIKYGEAEEQIKRLKEQSNSDATRYEQLLDSFRAENTSQIEMEKKKLYKECDEKIKNLSDQCTEYKTNYEQLKKQWDENEDAWNNKFDLIVTERNSLKRKVKSLQTDLSEIINKNNGNNNNNNNNNNNHHIHIENDKNSTNDINEKPDIILLDDFQNEEEVKMDHHKTKQIEQLKEEILELKKSHNDEKTALLQNIQRLSSKSVINSKGSDMQFLVNSLSNLISEKEDIISSLQSQIKNLGKVLQETIEENQSLKTLKK